MLRKLIKYEFKATSRWLLPINGVMLIFALINRLFLEVNFFDTQNPWITSLAVGMLTLYIMVIVAAFVLTLIIVIQRFYKNLLTDEGYLMFTLPVKAHSHIISKGIVATVWYIVSGIIAIFSIMVLAADGNTLDGLSVFFSQELPDFFRLTGAAGVLCMIELLVLLLLSLVSGILMIYCSIALGSLFHTHKILAAFGIYLAINFVMQIVSTVAILIGIPLIDDAAMWSASGSLDLVANVIFPICIAFFLVFCVVFYCITNFIFKRKLNLE